MQLIFEIGCEELPPSFCEPALDQIEHQFCEHADRLRIVFDRLHTVATPRRLTLLVDGLADTQTDLEEERTGPPAHIAFDDGDPSPAAKGFARGQGVDVADLYTVDTDKGEYVAAQVFEAGAPTRTLLGDVLEAIVAGLSFPKSMRWATRKERFGRPVRWMLAVAGGETIPVSFAGVDSSNKTYGHRFAAPEPFVISSIDEYVDGLAQAHVTVDADQRRAVIRQRLGDIAADIGGRLVEDPALVDEVAYLVEEPHAIAITFEDAYLELPDEVLISSMRSHQRYFSIADRHDGELMSVCGVIYNTPVERPDHVYDGNLRVLSARLEDARFFWEKDLQTPLAERVDRLDDVVWLDKLGSLKDRVVRISRLAGAIGEALGFDRSTREAAERAGRLSKADLVTDMVGEFPDLQGVMGREYAAADGEAPPVATAIYEQYLPRGADDQLPTTAAGAAVALAEKLDAMAGCFGVDLIPTSTSDPYALRRAAVGVIRILQDREYTIGLSRLFGMAIDAYQAVSPDAPTGDRRQWIDRLVDFTTTRLKYQLIDDYPTDVVDAVLAVNRDAVLSARERVDALADLRDEPDFEPLAVGFKRVVNILRKEAHDMGAPAESVDADRLVEPRERALYAASQQASDEIADALDDRDWTRACRVLIRLKEPVDDFFDQVMVMADDPALQANRMALLDQLRALFMKVADMSKIQA